METKEKKADGKVAAIKKLFADGKTKQEIIELGYSKGTVQVQLCKYKKELKKISE